MKKCLMCGKEIEKKKQDSKKRFEEKKFCSSRCYGMHIRKPKNPKTQKQIEFLERKEKIGEYGSHKNSCHQLYDCWRNIKRRCYNNNTEDYKNYGGRGIEVCEEWKKDYIPFLEWALENGFEEGLTIDRIDNSGNYEPNNCRWITQKEQLRNRRNTRFIEYNGVTKTISEWADDLGIHRATFNKRVKRWGIKKAIEEPINKSCSRS